MSASRVLESTCVCVLQSPALTRDQHLPQCYSQEEKRMVLPLTSLIIQVNKITDSSVLNLNLHFTSPASLSCVSMFLISSQAPTAELIAEYTSTPIWAAAIS